MGSTSRKMRRQSDKLSVAQKRTYNEDEAYRHVLGYAPPLGIKDLKDAVTDFVLEPHKYPTPAVVVKKWRSFGMKTDEIIDRLINIYAYTENLAVGMLGSVAPGAGTVMQEELYDLVPDQNDEQAVAVRERLLSTDDGITNMRHWIWGNSVAQRKEHERETTDEQRKIQRACSAIERAKLWPALRVRDDDHGNRLHQSTAGYVLRDLHSIWDPITQSTNKNEDLVAYLGDVDDPDFIKDEPKREERLDEVLRLQSLRTRDLSEIVYRSITLAYTALEQQQKGLGEAYVEEMTGETFEDLIGETRLRLVNVEEAK